jgi:hypothetical protein
MMDNTDGCSAMTWRKCSRRQRGANISCIFLNKIRQGQGVRGLPGWRRISLHNVLQSRIDLERFASSFLRFFCTAVALIER